MHSVGSAGNCLSGLRKRFLEETILIAMMFTTTNGTKLNKITKLQLIHHIRFKYKKF